MKLILRASSLILGILSALMVITSIILGIWTEGARWFATGVAAVLPAFAGIAIATYPGWDDK